MFLDGMVDIGYHHAMREFTEGPKPKSAYNL
jgi:hypothetical protein